MAADLPPDHEVICDPPSLPPLPTGQERKALLGFVDIYHPSYPDLPPLLSLHASDGGGVHYSVVYYACCIIAGNVWDDDEGRNGDVRFPYLSETRSGPPIVIPPDDILRGKEYYFHVPKDRILGGYPVVPSFDYWVFPDEMPKPWRSLKTSSDDDDETLNPSDLQIHIPGDPAHTSSCAIYYYRIIPLSAQMWFDANHMRKYAPCLSHGEPQSSTCNIVPLRADIHHLFDYSQIALVPKPDPHTPGAYRMVIHVLQRPHGWHDPALELIALLHNRKFPLLEDVPVEYFFASFAWSLFADSILQLFNRQNDVYFDLLFNRDFKTPGVHSISSRRGGYWNSGFPRPRSRLPRPEHNTRLTTCSRSQVEGDDADSKSVDSDIFQ
ncbi:hypothetical protein F4818DRAFT_400007 [Hypoxylon cercidicola]|nr:hypothetical protein F4818DRAFT_400007 [Hypoxylon cercidicola]